MIKKLRRSGGNVLGYTIRGTVGKADFQRIDREIQAVVQRHGTVRLLVNYDGLAGMDLNSLPNDLHMARFLGDIERYAVVSNSRVYKWLAAAANAVTSVDMQHFPATQERQAWKWLKQQRRAPMARAAAPATSNTGPQPQREHGWQDLALWQKAGVVVLAAVQIGLFVAAWRDLNQRSAHKINGSKQAWRAALFINTIGPLAYFSKGRKQSNWTEADVPDMHGKVAIVTGSNSGIGYEAARVLAQRGATVVMACRNLDKANHAAEQIRALHPAGDVAVMQLDLADLESVREFADSFKDQYDHLDLLINNAGIMVPPFGTTEQGFETQFGTNHLGHFALTGALLDLLNATPSARVVNVSSAAHRFGTMDFDDLNWQYKQYQPWQAYGQSKLANLLFTYELQRRLAQVGSTTIAAAAHPGWSATNLQGDTAAARLMNRLFAQPPAMGALPTLRAATDRAVHGGDYFGPSGLGEVQGNPERVDSNERSHNEIDAQRLWTVSEALTNTPFPL